MARGSRVFRSPAWPFSLAGVSIGQAPTATAPAGSPAGVARLGRIVPRMATANAQSTRTRLAGGAAPLEVCQRACHCPLPLGLYRACVPGPSCTAMRPQGRPQRRRPGSARCPVTRSGSPSPPARRRAAPASGPAEPPGRDQPQPVAAAAGQIHADYDPIRSPTRLARSAALAVRLPRSPCAPEAFARSKLLVLNCRYILGAALGASAIGG